MNYALLRVAVRTWGNPFFYFELILFLKCVKKIARVDGSIDARFIIEYDPIIASSP